MDQVKTLFRSSGWTVHIRKRRKGTRYVYAARRVGEAVKEVYFAPWSKVEHMTEEQVLEKLATIAK